MNGSLKIDEVIIEDLIKFQSRDAPDLKNAVMLYLQQRFVDQVVIEKKAISLNITKEMLIKDVIDLYKNEKQHQRGIDTLTYSSAKKLVLVSNADNILGLLDAIFIFVSDELNLNNLVQEKYILQTYFLLAKMGTILSQLEDSQADQEVRMLNEAVRVTISSMYLFSSESQPEYGKSFIRKVCSVKPDLDSNTGSIDFMPFDISNIKTRKKKEL
ncbi:hypothetical protein NFB50_16605 [Yersinia ruckeri]|uniref:hypothetical protein n=1 Tax=Yersinia ruckeri TaxID=29486 RepID=UPI0020BF680A|nr:hypothetical protein [Yersinia ruckeri]HDL6786975.1 hypothetical protein [Yersinia enterocolitica]MCW6560081.1 hypothetical protein [Yersinia ruckeri]MCW6595984.1 hypothetical protein [Yersinia ruckeri]UZY16824.1 hypothetical protein LNQ37_017750 [Yersinia ruckeri]HDM8387118.1 hypothetical protein [Yersinia enterocolitica]